jgi:hypothetical protein
MKHIIFTCFTIAVSLSLTACAELGLTPAAGPVATAPAPTTPVARPSVPEAPRSAEDFDSTTAKERKAAVIAASAPGTPRLGTTIASLGNPAEQGFWMKTPLVKTATKGRIEYPVTGTSVEVDLIPLGGPATGGSQVSLAALRLLGAPLTALPELVVFGQ